MALNGWAKSLRRICGHTVVTPPPNNTVSKRAILFIDYENAYQRARELFHGGEKDEEDTHGHFHPWKLGELICRLNNEIRRPSDPLSLVAVRVYRGMPDSKRDVEQFSRARARKDAWEEVEGVIATTPPLQYDNLGNPREKEVDVKLALDLVTFARDRRYDVGILFSGDNDFRPALRYVRDDIRDGPSVEVAAWGLLGVARHVDLEGHPKLVRHYLPEEAYLEVADTVSYPGRRIGRAHNRRRKRHRKHRR